MGRHLSPVRLATVGFAVVVGVALSTIAVAALERWLGVPNASSVYVVAVAAVAILFGIAGAALTAVIGVIVYDFLFTDPVHTLTVADPGEWLNLVLLLFVAVTVGQLAALQRRRAETAVARDEESRALFQVSRSLATRESLTGALPAVIDALARSARMDEISITLGPDDASERVVARSGQTDLRRTGRAYSVLHPVQGEPARWTLVRPLVPGRAAAVPGGAGGGGAGAGVGAGNAGGGGIGDDNGAGAGGAGLGGPRVSATLFRVRITESGTPAGSIWAERRRDLDLPTAPETALLLVAADLLGQALAHDRLAEETRRAEIARQSDAVKTALLESVSHNLRTPLASIRASAGTLMDPEVRLSDAEARASAVSIDREAQRLNRLVGNLLDLSRIEGGALRAAAEVIELDDVVSRAAAQVRPRMGDRRLELDVSPGADAQGDPVMLEEAVANLFENAGVHTPDGSIVRATAGPSDDPGFVRLTVEDSGPGVPDASLDRIFEKFYRDTPAAGARGRGSGSGIGLAVVRGFVEAMHGRVSARRSALGGLAIDIDLPGAPGAGAAADGDIRTERT